MSIPPVIQLTVPETGVAELPVIIEVGHIESGTLARDNGAAPPVNYFALRRGTLVTKDSVSGKYLPTLYSGIDAQGPASIMLLAGAQLKALDRMEVGDVVSFFQIDGTPISAAHNVTDVTSPNFTVDGAPVTIPAGGGIVSRDSGTYTGSGTGVLFDGEWTQSGVSGDPTTLGAPIYSDQGGQIMLSGTINPVYVIGGTDEALALLPGAMLQVTRPAS